MNKLQRKSCKDIFNAFLVKRATYDGLFEFPCIHPTYEIPNRMISFSKAISCKNYDQWIHFFEYDYLFERIWRHPRKYLEILKRFKGVILPDFSTYRDMPLAMQIWNIYRSRAIGHWLQLNGVTVIPNMRFGDRRTYRICCDGISKHCVIAFGSHGNMKRIVNRAIFMQGFDEVVRRLEPTAVVIYGSFPKQWFQKYIDDGLEVICFSNKRGASQKEVA